MAKPIKYGKPNGITLRAHTDHVKQFGKSLRKQFPFWAEKYRQLTGNDLDRLCTEAEEYHDYGKWYSEVWRSACAKDVAKYHDWLRSIGESTERVDRHLYNRYQQAMKKKGEASAPCLLKAGVRHEFASLHYLAEKYPDTDEVITAAIAAHHGKLAQNKCFVKRWRLDGRKDLKTDAGPYFVYFRNFRGMSRRASDNEDCHQLVLRRYRFAAIRALLQLADTRASCWEGQGDEGLVPLLPFTAPRGFGPDAKLRPVQQAAVDAASDWRTILRAPTGSGKTYASLLWAEQQILSEHPRADRLVIAMPTRFTSNALRKAVIEQMPDVSGAGSEGEDESQVGLYHSSAFFNLYGEEGDDSFGSKLVERQKLARYLAMPITVCTVDHLLACLTGTREQHYSTFFFLANSCVVFDETDFYDEFVQANIQKLLEVLDVLKVPTLIMSATVPDSARKLYKVTNPIRETAQPGAERVFKQLQFLGPAHRPEETAAFLNNMLDAGEGIIYANTVARALAYYEYLQPKVEDIPLTIYHSRFTEPDKARIEQELEASLGKSAHESGRARGIVIMTQIGEMSINISSRWMLTDCCPWDRLAQRVGRLARFATTGSDTFYATVAVVEPIDEEGEAYAWPYVEELLRTPEQKRAVYQPVIAYSTTLQEIGKLCATGSYRLTPENLVQHTNALYAVSAEFNAPTKENQKAYNKLIKCNWLLTGDERMSDEETQTNTWQSRNIVDQITVLTEVPQGRFYRYGDFQKFALIHGVSCPLYKVKGEFRKQEGDKPAIGVMTVIIGPKEKSKPHKIYYAIRGAYDPKMGLSSIYGYPWQADQNL